MCARVCVRFRTIEVHLRCLGVYMYARVRVVSRCVYVCLCMCGVWVCTCVLMYVCAHVSVLIWCGVRGCIWCVLGVSKYGGGWIVL